LNDAGIHYVDEFHIAADQILHAQIAAPNRHAATFTTQRPLRCSRVKWVHVNCESLLVPFLVNGFPNEYVNWESLLVSLVEIHWEIN
jgi:hypothetical protein